MTLLERAINYTLGSLHLVTPDALARPTPCRDWDLRALLTHLDDALQALTEAVDTGQVALAAVDGTGELVATLRGRARRLLRATAVARHPELVTIGGHTLTSVLVVGTGAIEITVHGWDVARACGRTDPVPPALADELLDLAPLLVACTDRPGRFDRPVPVPPGAAPGDRLVAFLGRQP